MEELFIAGFSIVIIINNFTYLLIIHIFHYLAGIVIKAITLAMSYYISVPLEALQWLGYDDITVTLPHVAYLI